MELDRVLETLVSEFESGEVEYALIGGYALGFLGMPRATIDLDFLVNRDDTNKIDVIMAALGYNKSYESENVSQYVSPDKVFGQVDFLYAFRDISRRMLKSAQREKAFSGRHHVRVLRPEDIIGLKVQAAVNDPSRERLEFVDIAGLARKYVNDLDWDLIKDYFFLFDKRDEFESLRSEIGATD